MKDLKVRIISGVIGLALLIAIVSIGGDLLKLSVMGLSLVGLYEFSKALKNININILHILGYLTIVFIFMGDINFNMSYLVTGLAYLLLLSLLTRRYTIEDIGATIIAIFYIGNMLSYVPRLAGNINIWLLFVIAFATDTFAYFGGNIFGKNKLCPNISPNKTVEGFLAGILGSLILSIVFARILNPDKIFSYIPLAIIGAILSQAGDLVASSIKRYTGIKDYGNLIPGHGGVLDRFDSIIFISPLVYYYVEVFLK